MEESLELLLELELLVRGQDGQLRRGEPTWTTGHEVRSLAVANYHRQMLARAADSIEHVDSSKRHLSAITACIDEARVSEIKARIHSFRESLIHTLEQETRPQRVYQLNIQFFPLTQGEEAHDS